MDTAKPGPTIHLFTVQGKTFTFHDCVLETDNETSLVFTYQAVSDGRLKRMYAIKANLAGHSVSY